MDNSFLEGAKLFLDAQGVKDQAERTRLLGELQRRQMATERFRQFEIMEKISTQQQGAQRQQAFQGEVAQTFAPKPVEGGAFTEQNIPAPGQEGEFYLQKMLPIAARYPEQKMPEFVDLAKALQNPGGMTEYQRQTLDLKRQALEKPPTPKMPPSAGNAVDLAIKRKFGSDYLSDPQKSMVADQWLGTPEGIAAVKQAALELTPPAYSFQVTSEGIVPGITRGPGAGTLGQTTGMKRPLSAEALGRVGELNTILQNIEQTKILYGYNTGAEHEEWVGPIAGRKGSLETKYIGTASPKQVKFYSYVKDMQDALLRARSGAQINEQEFRRLVSFLPDPNLPPASFRARLERFQEATQIMRNEKLSAFGQGGYGVSGLQEKTPPISGRTPVRRGKVTSGPNTGKTVIQYSDGSKSYE